MAHESIWKAIQDDTLLKLMNQRLEDLRARNLYCVNALALEWQTLPGAERYARTPSWRDNELYADPRAPIFTRGILMQHGYHVTTRQVEAAFADRDKREYGQNIFLIERWLNQHIVRADSPEALVKKEREMKALLEFNTHAFAQELGVAHPDPMHFGTRLFHILEIFGPSAERGTQH